MNIYLTDEQREKVSANVGLVGHIAKRFMNTKHNLDDLISEGYIGLIKAVATYDDSKGVKKATYYGKCIENEILYYLRRMRKHDNIKSLDEAVSTDENGKELNLLGIIEHIDDISRVWVADMFEDIKSLLTDRELKVLRLRMHNLKQKQIAKLIGVSQPQIFRIERRAKYKIKQHLKV